MRSIEISEPGEYWCAVWENPACPDTAWIEVIEETPPQPEIIAPEYLCAGETIELTTNNEYASYLWSNGETTRTIEIDQPGEYSVEVTDTNGCTGSASIDIIEKNVAIDGIEDQIFGDVYISQSDNKQIVLTNESENTVIIDRIYPEPNITVLSIHTDKQLPAELQEEEQIIITADFAPTEEKQYEVIINIEVNDPCEFADSFIISGVGIKIPAKSIVWLPDTTARPGEKLYIDLKANIEDFDPAINPVGYTAEVAYDSRFFSIEAPNPEIYDSEIMNSEQTLYLKKDNINLHEGENVLARIHGMALLPDGERTPLIIKDFRWSNEGIETETQNGSLSIIGVCAPGLRAVHGPNLESIELYPNPTSGEITIKTIANNKLSAHIKLINTLGKELLSNNINISSGAHEQKISLDNVPSGMYLFVINIGGRDYSWKVVRE
jgi:hypothetical protein